MRTHVGYQFLRESRQEDWVGVEQAQEVRSSLLSRPRTCTDKYVYACCRSSRRQTRQTGLGCARVTEHVLRYTGIYAVFCITAASHHQTTSNLSASTSCLNARCRFLMLMSSFVRPAQEYCSRHNSHISLLGFKGRELDTQALLTLNHNSSPRHYRITWRATSPTLRHQPFSPHHLNLIARTPIFRR